MIVLAESEDRFHGLTAPGAYEWTWFDGLSEDGRWGFVAVWFRGSPTSPYYTAAIDRWSRRPSSSAPPDPGDYCAFNLSVYRDGRRVFHALHELPGSAFEGSERTPDVRLGANTAFASAAQGGGRTFILGFDTNLPWQRSRLIGDIQIRFRPQSLGAVAREYDPRAGEHFWVPAALDGEFKAQLDVWRLFGGTDKLRFSGRAYHDRHFGVAPLHRLKGDWHWGRLHSGSRVFVYCTLKPDDPAAPADSRLLLLDGGRLVAHADGGRVEEGEKRSHRATLAYPSHLALAGGAIEAISRPQRVVESWPFCHRSLSSISVRLADETFADGIGIAEYLRPSRLGIAPFRPFVKFRMRRVSKAR